jgi:hypothetical protein
MRLLKNKTIDKNVQEQIIKEKDHRKNVLLRVIVIVKNLVRIIWHLDEKMKGSTKKSMKLF